MNFSKQLIKWYLENKRELPWRNTTNPYLIWLSEIMLQQTRVAQGLPYYLAFTNAFPTVFDLANANEEKVLKLWQGLGYYSRARNLHLTAQIIVHKFGGVFPNNYNDLLELKGIGEYTAAAIASFSFQEPVPVVDGNVFRVLARVFGIESDISLSKTKNEFSQLAFQLMPTKQPDLFNQAIMEFGALQCVPKNPNCQECIFKQSCFALQKKQIEKLPVKLKKIKIVKRYFNYIIYNDSAQNTLVKKRTERGIWHNLYEFPLIETQKNENVEAIKVNLNIKNTIVSITELTHHEIIHKLSHQHLNIKFWRVTVNGALQDGISVKKMVTLPFPIVLFNFIEKEWNVL